MLEKLNDIDYRYRLEGENTLLAFNVITSEMIFLKGNSKAYVDSLLKGISYNGKINQKNKEMLIKKGIIIGE